MHWTMVFPPRETGVARVMDAIGERVTVRAG